MGVAFVHGGAGVSGDVFPHLVGNVCLGEESVGGVAEMSEDQRRQVFKVSDSGDVAVRDEEAQKAYFANRAAQLVVEQSRLDGLKKVERVGWKVEAGKVWVKEEKVETGLTRRDLVTMLRDLGG